MRRTIYLDTTLWNKLYEQAVAPELLVEGLRREGWDLAFGTHLRYELAKTFRSKRPGMHEKARLLFLYLEQFLGFRIPCVKQVPDLLREEVKSADGQLHAVECFYRDELYEREAMEITKLAAGSLDSRIESVLDFRATQVSEFRMASPGLAAKWAQFLDGNTDVCLSDFMADTWRGLGPGCLKKHVSELFPGLVERDLKRIARKILSAPRYRLSHALVRGDLYLNWRCLRGRVVARDTSDDCYHLANAAYCEVYATDESSQGVYADEVLTLTEIRIHDRKAPLLEWLTSTAISGRPIR
jgi:hypothetical protein